MLAWKLHAYPECLDNSGTGNQESITKRAEVGYEGCFLNFIKYTETCHLKFIPYVSVLFSILQKAALQKANSFQVWASDLDRSQPTIYIANISH